MDAKAKANEKKAAFIVAGLVAALFVYIGVTHEPPVPSETQSVTAQAPEKPSEDSSSEGVKVSSTTEVKEVDERQSKIDEVLENKAILNYEYEIRMLLKDPSSAKFSNIVHSSSSGVPVTCGRVNSKNSFGAYQGSQRFISNGLQVNVLEEQMERNAMNELWAQFCQ